MQQFPTELSASALSVLSERLSVPRYDRRQVRPGIAHISVGNFHRAHQARYIDQCLHLPEHHMWAILGIGLGIGVDADRKASALHRQDCLYTLSEYAADGACDVRIIGSLVDYIHAPTSPSAVLDRLCDPSIRILSLTITEGGYNIAEATGEFDLTDPGVIHDLSMPGAPRTAFGFVVEALDRRRRADVGPFTVMTCDNLRHNGDVAKLAFTSFAREKDRDLARWIEDRVTFPNSMVDRIVPTVDEAGRQRLNQASGVDDLVPVMAEDFIQWVVEDRFCAGRPDLASAGVELRGDVREFEAIKGRMLNASHMTICFPALLLGYREVHHAMSHTLLVRLLEQCMEKDAMPLLKAPAGVDLGNYKTVVMRRFSNPAIRDQLLRICGNGAVKLPTFLFKTLASCLSEGRDIRRFALVFACFARYLRGCDEGGSRFGIDEPHIGAVEFHAAAAGEPLDALRLAAFGSLDLAGTPAFAQQYLIYADMIASNGVTSALQAATCC